MSEEVVETIPKMTLWCEVHKELKKKEEKMTLIYEVDEFIIQLNKKLKENIVHKERKYLRVHLEENMLKLLIEHNYRFLGTDRGGNHHSFCMGGVKLDSKKRSNFLGGKPSLVMFSFHFPFLS